MILSDLHIHLIKYFWIWFCMCKNLRGVIDTAESKLFLALLWSPLEGYSFNKIDVVAHWSRTRLPGQRSRVQIRHLPQWSWCAAGSLWNNVEKTQCRERVTYHWASKKRSKKIACGVTSKSYVHQQTVLIKVRCSFKIICRFFLLSLAAGSFYYHLPQDRGISSITLRLCKEMQ